MMSYVSVYENKTPRTKGVILAGAVHAVIIAGVIAMPGIEIPEKFRGTVIAVPVLAQKPPEPVKHKVEPVIQLPVQPQHKAPDKLIVDLPAAPVEPLPSYAENTLDTGLTGAGYEIPFEAIKVAPDPVIVDARLNSRYAAHFQPAYPPGQLRLEREAEVSVRVLVGTDGRVRQIELIDSPHPDFWAATRKQALSKWRFTPATRDGKPFESWMTLKVRFEINS